MIKCPTCGKTNCIAECTPSTQQPPLESISIDKKEDDYYCYVIVSGILEGGKSVEFDKDSKFACSECGTKWTSPLELAVDVLCIEH